MKNLADNEGSESVATRRFVTRASFDADTTQLQWFQDYQREIQDDYVKHYGTARGGDSQRAGHGGEQTWARFLRDWLPPQYEVVGRKYILTPNAKPDVFEMDLVVLNPSYPERLRQREEILSGGVAATFSIKNRMKTADIEDLVRKSDSLKQSQTNHRSARTEMLPPFPVGLLAHTQSSFKGDLKSKREKIEDRLDKKTSALEHPRYLPDCLCIADVGTWRTYRCPIDPDEVGLIRQGFDAPSELACITSISGQEDDASPVGVLVTWLLMRLSYENPALERLGGHLRFIKALGSGTGIARAWPIEDVFSEQIRKVLVERIVNRAGPDWDTVLY